MNLAMFVDIVVEPTLSMILDIYKGGGILYEDAQRIGMSFADVLCCVDGNCHYAFEKFEGVIDDFEEELDRLKVSLRKEKVV